MVQSALLGTPPKTETDFFIARAMLLFRRPNGMKPQDPAKGATLPPFRPPPSQYRFETNGPGFIAGMSVCIAIMVAVTGTRLMLRYFRSSLRWGADDWLIIVAVIFALSWPIIEIYMVVHGGSGKHMYDITYHEWYTFRLLGSVARITFYVSVGLIKMSITAFNMRLTGLSSPNWMIAHFTFMAVLVCFVLTSLFIYTFRCTPPAAGFSQIVVGKMNVLPKCLREDLIGRSLSAVHVVTDFCLLAVPIIVLWKVKMSQAAKLRLYIVFSIGSFSCVASILRQHAQTKLKYDIYFNMGGLIGWSLADLTTAVVTASLPVLSTLIPYGRSTSRKRSAGSPGQSSGSRGSRLASMNRKQPQLESKASGEGIVCQTDIELADSAAETASADDNYIHGSGDEKKEAVRVSVCRQ